VQNGRNRLGEKVQVSLPDGRAIAAVIASPVFLDPEGARQNA
jgi:glycine cleavage system aminomethyltransferase T